MDLNYLNVSHWLAIPRSVRDRFAKVFGLSPSTSVHVSDNQIVTDGYTQEDLKPVTLEALQSYTGSDSKDFYALLDSAVTKTIKDLADEHLASMPAPEEKPPIESITVTTAGEEKVYDLKLADMPKEKRGRKKKII